MEFTMELDLKIPSNINNALKIPNQDKEKTLLIELATSLYYRGFLSFGKARELARLTKWEFHEELGKREISRHYNFENFLEDMEYGNKI